MSSESTTEGFWKVECSLTADAGSFVLGDLDAACHARFQDHLIEGCGACGTQVFQLRAAAGRLDREVAWAQAQAQRRAALDESALPSPLLERLRERMRSQARPPAPLETQTHGAHKAGNAPSREWQSWTEDMLAGGDLSFVRAGTTSWRATAFAGVSVRPLSVDQARRSVSMLVRMEPGSSYPGHVHGGREECLVLAGDLDVDGEAMREGDYQVAQAGSHHGLQSTRGGCTLFIVSSQYDRMDS